MKGKKKSKNTMRGEWEEISRNLIPLQLDTAAPGGIPDTLGLKKLSEEVSHELIDVLKVIISICDQMLSGLKKEEPLYYMIEKIKRTSEYDLYFTLQVLSLNYDNDVVVTGETAKVEKLIH